MTRPAVQRLADLALAALVAGVGVTEVWAPLPSVAGSGSRPFSTAVVLVFGAALVLRRVWPLPVLLVIVAVFVGALATGELYVLFWGGFLPFAVAVFSSARHGSGREPFFGAAAAAAALLYIDFFVEELQTASEVIFHWLVITLVWSFGWGLQVLERRATDSTQRAIRAEVAAAEQAMAAIIEERTRIARELHDVVAHAVSMMVVQAGAAEQMVDDDPAYVRTALKTIRTSGAGALSEMRRVVTMLRDESQAGALAPQPGVAALPALVEEARAAGLAVSLTTEGNARDLPAGLDLAVYRIAQEALTNVRRHAHAARADIVLRYAQDEVELEVSDDGQGTTGPTTTGHGLVGMRERAALYGGQVETESHDGSGFTVRALLPVEP